MVENRRISLHPIIQRVFPPLNPMKTPPFSHGFPIVFRFIHRTLNSGCLRWRQVGGQPLVLGRGLSFMTIDPETGHRETGEKGAKHSLQIASGDVKIAMENG